MPPQAKITKTEKKQVFVKGDKVFPVQAPRGVQDILPQEQKYWEFVVETAKLVLRGWDFRRVDTPIFEETRLFTRGLGDETDIVSKEMFELKARGGGAHYSLRPEGTAPIVRAYIEHGMRSWPKPVKLFYVGPIFRYDRPQKGRWRQHHQFGLEVFGSAHVVTDVQVMYIIHVLLAKLGLEDYIFHVNSLGDPADRKVYIKLLKEHYRRNRSKLCRDCKQRLKTNPLRVLDCKEEKCQQVANTAPHLLDHLSEEARHHFESVLQMLEDLKVPHEVVPSLVRGMDYYTGVVWEVFPAKPNALDVGEAQSLSQQSDLATNGQEDAQTRRTEPRRADSVQHSGQLGMSLAAGGRYDHLVKELGGKDIPAVGGSAGVERIIDSLKEEGIELTVTDRPQVFVAHLGEQAKLVSLELMQRLQEMQIPFAEALDRDGMQAQLKIAERLGVKWTIIVGQKEVMDKTVILSNLASGMQEVVKQDELIDELRKRLDLLGKE